LSINPDEHDRNHEQYDDHQHDHQREESSAHGLPHGAEHRPGADSASRGKGATPQGSRRADRMLAAPFEPAMPAPAEAMEVVAPHEGAVAVEVDADLIPGPAARTPALV
jgi:hypothetical protein